ncbi:arrestin domain-containing protein 2-like [Contarinia nasturtii]|uniref:arrestin domain-containing protein 2-like n=1 Tax=Contarinia nasturtii TaxID=265458 RepID=UPI0012D43643|nr:arrestin domain-containing protein 2-like [Contarinia nasturtii]
MPTTCKVEFENSPRKIVYSGQLLKGTCEIAFRVPKTLHGIYIRLKGSAYVQWKQGKRVITGQETYIDELKYFVGGPRDEIHLQPGTYNYAFEFKMSESLPSSIEGRCGRISYSAHVVFDSPGWTDKKFHIPFHVLNPISLNENLPLRQPVIVDKEQSIQPFYMVCCDSELTNVSARIPVAGYAPGQTINISVTCNNNSSQPFYKFTAELLKEVTFYRHAGSSHDREEKSCIAKGMSSEGCEPKQVKTVGVSVDIPATVPSDIIHSNIVKIRYMLRVFGITPLLFNSTKLIIPITIGTFIVRGGIPAKTDHPDYLNVPTIPIGVDNVISKQPSASISEID